RILQGDTTLYITPKLLHLYLWTEWWDTYGAGADFDLDQFLAIDSTCDPPELLSPRLLGWFGAMFEYGVQSADISRVIRRFLGPDGPFRFNTLRTPLVAQLFYQLSQADPDHALTCLKRGFADQPREQLAQLTDSRRHIVPALEQIVIWRRL